METNNGKPIERTNIEEPQRFVEYENFDRIVYENKEELILLQKDCKRIRKDYKTLCTLRPDKIQSYREQLKKTLNEVEEAAIRLINAQAIASKQTPINKLV